MKGYFLCLIKKKTSPNLSPEKKTNLIRSGNKAFNEGNIQLAARIFQTTLYKDGLIRVADYYYANKQPMLALSYYKLANHQTMLNKIDDTMIEVIRAWLNEKS